MTCHHTPAGPMLRTHARDCEAADCGGCKPCAEHHCQARGRCIAHVPPTELACGSCIGNTRNNLTMIVTLSALMLGEAIAQGVNSHAAMLAGPAAPPADWTARQIERRQELDAQHGLDGDGWDTVDWEAYESALKSLIADDDPRHPLSCLGWWEIAIRGDYGPDTDARITVVSAAEYLDRMLHRIANDPNQDFPLFAREIRSCRAHLEAVLHDSHAPETGAPCPACTSAQPLVKHYDDTDTTGASDRWTCRDCQTWWSEADYRLRVAARYLEHATALTASQIETEYRVPQGTLRRWVVEGNVKRAGRDESGRQLYRVSDVRDMRDTSANVSADGLRARPHEDA